LSLTKNTGASHSWWTWTLPIWKWSGNRNEQNHLRQAANYRKRACRTNRDFAVSVDLWSGEHVRFFQDTRVHQARGGVGYLQAVRVWFGHHIMSELQDKLDRGEITPQELFDAWDLKMEERERLHPGFHDRVLWFLDGQVSGWRRGCRQILSFGIIGSIR
jgi:hypothetical protein